MLAFALSFDEIIVTTFTAGHERTLPIWLLNQLSRPRDVPVTNVVAMLVMMVTCCRSSLRLPDPGGEAAAATMNTKGCPLEGKLHQGQ